MERILRMPKWNDILLKIHSSSEKSRYCEKLNKKIKGSRSYLRTVVRLLAQHRFIEIIPASKIKKLVITEKGKRVIIPLQQINIELKHL